MRREERRRTSLGSKVQNHFWDSPFCFWHSSFATYVDSPRRSFRDLSHLLYPKVKLRRERGLQWKVNQFCSATSQTNLSHPIPGRKHKAPLLRKKPTQAKQNLFEPVVNNARAKLFAFLFLQPPRRGEEKGGSKDVTKYPFRLASSWLKPPPPPPPSALVTAAASSCRTLKGGRKKELLLLLDDTVQTCVLQVESPPTSQGRAPFVLGRETASIIPQTARLAGGEGRGGGHFFTLFA